MPALKDLKKSLLEHTSQTIIVCALACEAKPFIDFFKLKKNTTIHAFSVYQSGSILLMVSGLGQIHMSAAVNWLSGYLNLTSPQFWLNVGVAGHATADVGHLFCIHKITHQQQNLYPTKWLKHKIALEQLCTFDNEETDYKKQGLYDMEGFAFYQAATRFNNQERVQCLKIVSDNNKCPVDKDKLRISALISQHLEAIITFIEQHTSALKSNDNEPTFIQWQQSLMQRIHLTHSQQGQFSKLLQAVQSHNILLNEHELMAMKSARDVLASLTHLLKKEAVQI